MPYGNRCRRTSSWTYFAAICQKPPLYLKKSASLSWRLFKIEALRSASESMFFPQTLCAAAWCSWQASISAMCLSLYEHTAPTYETQRNTYYLCCSMHRLRWTGELCLLVPFVFKFHNGNRFSVLFTTFQSSIYPIWIYVSFLQLQIFYHQPYSAIIG